MCQNLMFSARLLMRVVTLMASNANQSSKQVAPILFQRDNCLESNLAAYDRSSTSLNIVGRRERPLEQRRTSGGKAPKLGRLCRSPGVPKSSGFGTLLTA